MKDWFVQKTATEQKLLVIGAFISFLLLAYAFIYLPTARNNTTLEKRIATQQSHLITMQSMAKQVQKLSRTNNALATDSTQIMTLIERTAKQQKLNISQIKPLSKQRLLITLENSLFNDSIRWLDSLQKKSAVSVDKFNTQSNKKSVNFHITLSY